MKIIFLLKRIAAILTAVLLVHNVYIRPIYKYNQSYLIPFVITTAIAIFFLKDVYLKTTEEEVQKNINFRPLKKKLFLIIWLTAIFTILTSEFVEKKASFLPIIATDYSIGYFDSESREVKGHFPIYAYEKGKKYTKKIDYVRLQDSLIKKLNVYEYSYGLDDRYFLFAGTAIVSGYVYPNDNYFFLVTFLENQFEAIIKIFIGLLIYIILYKVLERFL